MIVGRFLSQGEYYRGRYFFSRIEHQRERSDTHNANHHPMLPDLIDWENFEIPWMADPDAPEALSAR